MAEFLFFIQKAAGFVIIDHQGSVMEKVLLVAALSAALAYPFPAAVPPFYIAFHHMSLRFPVLRGCPLIRASPSFHPVNQYSRGAKKPISSRPLFFTKLTSTERGI
jgi:hypothetical protein